MTTPIENRTDVRNRIKICNNSMFVDNPETGRHVLRNRKMVGGVRVLHLMHPAYAGRP